jgi:DNA polymerase-1
MKYLMIDGNNLAIRAAFANENLRNSEGVPTGVHFGVFQSLINLKNMYSDYQFLICWDGKSERRMIESENAVKNGIIKSAYKENRKKKDQPQPLLDFYQQAKYLQKGIAQTGIPQIRLENYETDDVIASYCKKLSPNEVIVVTSDADYYQILSDNVSVFDGMKQKLHTRQSFMDKYKIEPYQHVDVGALMGDDGDNIFGITGWGDKTALEAIVEHGSYSKLYGYLHNLYDSLRLKFPDLDEANLSKLTSIVTKSGKQKYAEVSINNPFTGVALAVEENNTSNISKNILMALMFEERVKLAYSLKKMDDDINNLPDIINEDQNKDRLLEYFTYYNIESLKNSCEELFKTV